MSLVIKNVKPSERPVKILTWDNVFFKDGYEDKYPVKKIVITIDAGGSAEMVVERYLLYKELDDPLYSSIPQGCDGPSTFKNYYILEDIKDAEISVTGPRCPQVQLKKAELERQLSFIENKMKNED